VSVGDGSNWVSTVCSCGLGISGALKMEAVHSSETSVDLCQTTWQYSPEDSNSS
jgi:hypothetical protein